MGHPQHSTETSEIWKVVSVPFDSVEIGIGFCDVRRAGLFVWGFIRAKRPVRSTGKSGLV